MTQSSPIKNIKNQVQTNLSTVVSTVLAKKFENPNLVK